MVELAIVLFIIGILAALMTPGLGRWLSHYRVKTAARDLASFFQRAKYQAIQGNAQVVVRFQQTSINGVTYDYYAFRDADGDYVYDAGETLYGGVRLADYKSGVQGDPYPPGFGMAGPVDDEAPCLSFNSRGLPWNGDAPMTAAQSAFFKNARNERYSVRVEPTGNVVVTKE